jgi:xanthine dehydrogenase accessory factor
MNDEVLSTARSWPRAALATVVSVKRSAPLPPGSKMAVNEQGEIAGAVSGGCVEGAVVVVAEEVLRGADPQLLHFGIADEEAWDVGLPCGGEIDIWVEPLGSDTVFEGERGAVVTAIAGPHAGAKLHVDADGARHGTLGDPALDEEAAAHAEELMWAERSEQRGDLFIDVRFPPPRLVIFGAVDYANALSRLASAIGWRPYVVDPRGRFAQPERFPHATDVIAGWPEEAFAKLGGIDRATAIVVLTHDPKLDDAALQIALRSEAFYIGAMGSRRAQAKRRERLLELGLDEALLERISAPVGLDIGALGAEETALSILSEVVAVKHGHDGGRLADAKGRIHEVGA